MGRIKRLSHADAMILSRLIRVYGIEGIALELRMILRNWAKGSFRYSYLAQTAGLFYYSACRSVGKAPTLGESES